MNEQNNNEETGKKINKRDYDILNWMALDEGTGYKSTNLREDNIMNEIYRRGYIGGTRL
jgi:hypothetical protein